MKRNLIADRPNGMTREDKMILEELEGRYGTSAVTAAIVNGSFPADDAQETVTVEDGEQTWRPAVTRVEGRAYASCAVCLREWIGLDQMRDLAAHVGEL